MKIFKGIMSSLITIILIPVIMVFIVYLSTRSIVSKQGVNDLFNRFNLSEILIDKDGDYTSFGNKIKNELVNNGVPEDVVGEVMDSKQVTEFISEYAGDAVNYIVYDADLNNLKADDISKFVNNNIDEIFDELKERKVEGYEQLTDERKEEIKGKVDELAKGVEKHLPDIQKMVDDSDMSLSIKILRIIFSNTMLMVFIILISILALLIVLLNLKKYAYGIWLGVISIVAALPFIIVSNLTAVISSDIEVKAVKDIIKYILGKTVAWAYVFLFVGIALIVLTIIVRIITKAFKKNNNDIVIDTPIVEETPIVNETPIVEETPTIDTPVESTPVVSEPAIEKQYSYCAQCGARMEPNQKFCYNCGTVKE